MERVLLWLLIAGARGLEASWRAVATPVQPSPRSGSTAAAASESSVFLFGGYEEDDSGGRRVVDDLWRYDAGAGWTLVSGGGAGGPGPRLCSALACVGGEVFLFGGWDPETAGTGGSILDDVWVYDTAADSWAACAPVPGGPVSRHACCALDGGEILVHTHRCAESVLVFDAAKRSWREQPTSGAAPSPRGLHVAARVEGGVVVFGGAAQSGEMCGDGYFLDTASWAWRKLAALGPAPRAGAAAAALAGGAEVVLVGGAARGGDGGLDPQSDVWVLDVRGDAWTKVEAGGAALAPRNAHVLLPTGPTTFVLHGGWHPFVRTFDDTLELDIAP